VKRPFSVSTKPTTPLSSASSAPSWREIQKERIGIRAGDAQLDEVAVEEPLEVRVHGSALAVLMRTPGREEDLIAGFLASEGVVAGSTDIAGVAPCAHLETGEPEPHIWNAVLAPGVQFDPRERRFGAVSASCGLCGTRTLEDLERQLPDLSPPPASIREGFLVKAFDDLRAAQTLFRKTGGTHGAALVDFDTSTLLEVAEDVGRHNAVDKVLGARLRSGDYPVQNPSALLVSGRISYEIIQKAALAAVGSVAGIGAPTSLAVDAAKAAGLTLVGMVKGGTANRYAGSIDLTGADVLEIDRH